MNNTKIEWTDSTWNPATGCTKISTGCVHCYAEKMANRLKAMGLKKYQNGFQLTLHPETLNEPYSWKRPRMVFVNSMSDLFHEDIPFSYIEKVFSVMNENRSHVFQILTKRDAVLLEYARHLKWTENIWMGVTVEADDKIYRIENLIQTPAVVKFLSCEPLLTPLHSLPLRAIDWVIVGGESGPGARPMRRAWVEDIHSQCISAGTPFFFKQWGGVNKKAAGRELNGRTYSEMPDIALAV
ncbi:MAG TPA: phage Gp37/Gp68 family protein [Spirochaetales bacterium]|nr:phage Gp37/Gp68 family protein [Spirochaetales bacterium]